MKRQTCIKTKEEVSICIMGRNDLQVQLLATIVDSFRNVSIGKFMNHEIIFANYHSTIDMYIPLVIGVLV